MANVYAVSLVVILLAIAFYFFSNSNQTIPGATISQTPSSTETTTQNQTTTQIQPTNFLQRRYYINVSSGKGVTWFDNSTVSDVRSAFSDWQNAENGFIKFNEVDSPPADITISFVSGISQNATAKTIGETFVSLGLIKGTIQFVPQGVPCRNVGIIAHELGHIIGLEHNETNRFDTMYPLQSYGCDQSISQYDIDQAHLLIAELIS